MLLKHINQAWPWRLARAGRFFAGNPSSGSVRNAFSLIELLVVISIMGILAGMLFVATPGVMFKRKKAVATAEMNEIVNAINAYKAQYNSFPADNPNTNNLWLNPLFYELVGTQYAPTSPPGTNDTFTVINPASTNTSANVALIFGGAGGFVNSTNTAQVGGDAYKQFLTPKPKRYAYYTQPVTGITALLLVCSVNGINGVSIQGRPTLNGPLININPWNYVATNPTNNSQGFDLWIDIENSSGGGSRFSRISNWSKPIDGTGTTQ